MNSSRQQTYKHIKNINIYKQEDGSRKLTQHEPIKYVSDLLQNKCIQNFTTYNLNIKQEYSIINNY